MSLAEVPPPTTERATQDAPQLFGPGDHTWDTFGDVLSVAMSGAAFLLQGMHPTISQVVELHSVYRTDPGGRTVRSTDSILLWVYGGEEAIAEGRRLLALHAPMKGTDPAGRKYRAMDPEAWGWVHGTAFVTAVQTAPYLTGKAMTRREEEELYDEMLRLGAILHVRPSELPPDVDAYWDYYETMVHDRLARTETADYLLTTFAEAKLPFLPRLPGPLGVPQKLALGQAIRLIVVGGMTPSARKVVGEPWTPVHEAALTNVMRVVRPLYQRLPEQYRYLPLAYHARQAERHARGHERELRNIRERALKQAPPARRTAVT